MVESIEIRFGIFVAAAYMPASSSPLMPPMNSWSEKPVNVHIIISEAEMNVLDNIKRKQSDMDTMQNNMVSLMRDVTMSEIKKTTRITTDYKPNKRMEIPAWIA